MTEQDQIEQLNPLRVYYEDSMDSTWEKLEDYCGVKEQTLILLSQKSKEGLKNIKLDTYYKIKKHLGIDFIEYIYKNK